ncbi:uncharacterized protein FOMMEDRAFT_162307 [Fomitiporia mediterranea MF3/22]|uniref:uncharacterized protein n=1 Tax=Fomitiporia mediterranea (strain MF3/22) TaxID=694068 RepID=UPI0004409C72|nr:uncharacterized protein FOMMEDRAFT_162307 [Fomitiporia mediterranea MF3/22]EJC97964.1 hypothetical protein FOMMEDRAFT_162307 [Fomitiporia mediterranea MF3/22]
MGQINSTRNTGNHDPVHEVDVASPLAPSGIEEGPANLTDAGLSAGRGGRRRSIRNSIIGIVRPRISSKSEGGEIQDVRERKKWFRRSRRMSKAQPTEERNSQGNLSGETERHQGASQRRGLRVSITDRGIDDTSDSPRIHNEHEATNGRPGSIPSHGPKPSTSLKGKERLDDVSDNSVGNSEAASSNQASGSGLSSSAPRGPSTAAGAPEATFPSPFDRPAVSPPSDHSPPMPAQNDNVLRQFPPAGTLVVVQGVVQTDGTPRTALDNPSSLGNTMQPSSFSNRNPVQRPSLSPEADQNSSRTYSDVSSTEGSRFSASSGFSEGSTINDDRGSSESSIPSGSPSGTGFRSGAQGPISPSSSGVDVLGALLSIVSVATAATAASLLSGPNGTFRSPLPSTERPRTTSNMSPTNNEGSTTSSVARALASTNPIAAAVLAQHERDREERERTRVRSIWEGFRSRVTSGRSSRGPLGRTLGSTFPSPPPPLTSGRNRMDDSPAIPDALFTELARAFHLSSSTPDERQTEAQNTSATNPNPDEDQDHLSGGRRSSDRETEDPAPDSFEQFLVDLQSDLRTALSRNDTAQNGPPTAGAANDSGTGEPANASRESNMDIDLPESPTTEATYHTASSNNNQSLNTPSVNDTGTEHTQPSPTSFNPDNGPSVTNPDQGTSTEPNQSTTSNNSSTTTNGRSRGNGVNWWRMYRFPPMQPTQPTQGNAARRRVDSNYLRERPPTPIPSSSPPNTGASLTDGQTTSEDAGTMVPVIVVGLQSISPGARRTTPLPPEFTRDIDNPIANETTREHMGGENGFVPRGPRGLHTARGPWPSRAPSRVSRRFGRLGRREDLPVDQGHEMPNAPNTTGGARTFFIYVFGGHYPPNHHIFSGSDALDSFEALWELADLLGQVKPPVVTEEDIERSGLELFKAKDLGEYESSGRVANNCIDRCLICLDEYNPDDDLRLLTCKHTFHKGCVDRWLKTGRNNCPACRTEGVKTSSSSSTSAPSL